MIRQILANVGAQADCEKNVNVLSVISYVFLGRVAHGLLRFPASKMRPSRRLNTLNPMKTPHVIAIAFAMTCSLAVAQNALTREQVVQVALANNRDLAAARVRIEEAQARLVQAGLWPNPELDLDGRFDNAFNNEGEQTLGVGVSQPISVSGRINARKRVAELELDRARAEVSDQERRLAGDVQRVHTEMLDTTAQIGLQEFLIAMNAELLRIARAALQRAELSQRDVTAIRIAQQQAQQIHGSLQARYASQRLDLNQLLGRSPEDALTVAGHLEDQARLAPAAVTLEQALDRRRADAPGICSRHGTFDSGAGPAVLGRPRRLPLATVCATRSLVC